MKSDQIKKGPERAPARAMLRATGLDDEQIYRPMIAVVNTWSDVTPCNMHLRELAEPLKEGIRAAGGTPFEFGSIVVTDGISMGSEGMRWSSTTPWPSRRARTCGTPFAPLRSPTTPFTAAAW